MCISTLLSDIEKSHMAVAGRCVQCVKVGPQWGDGVMVASCCCSDLVSSPWSQPSPAELSCYLWHQPGPASPEPQHFHITDLHPAPPHTTTQSSHLQLNITHTFYLYGPSLTKTTECSSESVELQMIILVRLPGSDLRKNLKVSQAVRKRWNFSWWKLWISWWLQWSIKFYFNILRGNILFSVRNHFINRETCCTVWL